MRPKVGAMQLMVLCFVLQCLAGGALVAWLLSGGSGKRRQVKMNMNGVLYHTLLDDKGNNASVIIDRANQRGTGWLRKVLQKNCGEADLHYLDGGLVNTSFDARLGLDADGLYGWKHTYVTPHELDRLQAADRHHIVVVWRDAVTWAASVFALRMFVGGRGKVKVEDLATFVNMRPVREHVPATPHLRRYYSAYNHTGGPDLVGDNIFDVRTSLYKNWLDMTSTAAATNRRVTFIHYEALRANTSHEVMHNLLAPWNITCQNLTKASSSSAQFQDEEFRVQMKTTSKTENTKRMHVRSKACTLLTEQSYADIMSKLDLQFEFTVLGYEYPSTMQEYCRGVPTLPPTPPPVTTKFATTRGSGGKNSKYNRNQVHPGGAVRARNDLNTLMMILCMVFAGFGVIYLLSFCAQFAADSAAARRAQQDWERRNHMA